MRWGSGRVVVVERKRGPVWYAQYRPSSGRQVQRALGPAWSGRGRPPAGYFTKRLAEDWLHDRLEELRRSDAASMSAASAVRAPAAVAVTFAEAAAEYRQAMQQTIRLQPRRRGLCRPTPNRSSRR